MKTDTYVLVVDHSHFYEEPSLYKNGNLLFKGREFFSVTETEVIFYETAGGQCNHTRGEITFIQNIKGANFRREG